MRAAGLRDAVLRAAVLRAAGLRAAGLRAAGLRAAGLRAAGLLAVERLLDADFDRAALERRDAPGERLDLAAEALEVLQHADLLDHLAHAGGRAGHLVDEVLRAGARGLCAVGGGLERPLDRRAHGADGIGA